MDFPGVFPVRPCLSWISPESLGVNKTPGYSVGQPGTGTWSSANRAIYMPLMLRAPFLVQKVWWANGTTVSGNCDVGLYTEGGVRLFSSGSTAQATVSVIQSVALSTPFLLTPGRYYLAMAMDNATGHIIRMTFGATGYAKEFGCAEQATAFVLPATATFATIASFDTFPLFGLTSRTVI